MCTATLSHRLRSGLLASIPFLVPAFAQAQSFELRWAGLVSDSFVRPDGEFWTAEDGGRIRHGFLAATTTFQTTPDTVRNTLRKIHFLADGQHGWACGVDGIVLATTNGGSTWTQQGSRLEAVCNEGTNPYEDLFDVHFVEPAAGQPPTEGWVSGLHRIWRWNASSTTPDWVPCNLLDAQGQPLDPCGSEIEFYSLDVIPFGAGYVGLASTEPGLVLRTFDGVDWKVIFDVRELCAGPTLTGCERLICNGDRLRFEAWDVELARAPGSRFAVMVGGVANGCGMIFTTDDAAAQPLPTWFKEVHECTCWPAPGCTDCPHAQSGGVGLYEDFVGGHQPSDTYRLNFFRTIYSVALFGSLGSGNAGVAGGYSGQTLFRDPTLVAGQARAVWRDRSHFSGDVVHAVDRVNNPMYGASASSAGARAILSGSGGYIRASSDAGDTWNGADSGEPWRIRDVCFLDAVTGWQVTQFGRIAKSTDGAAHWIAQSPEPVLGTGALNSIAFSPDKVHGVTVGEPALHGEKPRILWTDTGGEGADPAWHSPASIQLKRGWTAEDKPLNRVGFAGGLEFWAVGEFGLVFHSVDSGAHWTQFSDDLDRLFAQFSFAGLAFRDTTTGLLVGQRPDSAGTPRGIAYQVQRVGTQDTWTNLSPAPPPGRAIAQITDVAVRPGSNEAWAAGVLVDPQTGARSGAVFKSTFANGVYGTFVYDSTPAPAECDTDETATELPILTRIIALSNGVLFVGGQCGRVWRRDPATAWISLKSMTDAHIVGASFPNTTVGYFAGRRINRTQHSVVRYP